MVSINVYIRLLGLLTFLFLNISLAKEGGMVSSGGRIFEDENNPWFVRSTFKVNYCIALDESGISADPETIKELVKEAIEYWKKEFQKGSISVNRQGEYNVATQVFEESECSTETDLKFVLGYGKLKLEQIKFLQDPQKFIGVTIRETYDLKTLKAKGLIYISSDQGKYIYSKNDSLIEKAWSHPKLLKYALIHELGHVFGVPHMGDGVMSETFLDNLLNKDLYKVFLEQPVDTFVGVDKEIVECKLDGRAKMWLELDQSDTCIKIVEQLAQQKWFVYQNEKHIGTINLTNFMQDMAATWQPVGFLWVSDKQEVYTAQELKGKNYLRGPFRANYKLEAVYNKVGSPIAKKVTIQLNPNSFTMMGVLKNEIIDVIKFKSKLGHYLYAQDDIK